MKEPKSWNEDVPYEVRMKHVIQAYRNDQMKMGKLEAYVKHLEEEVTCLKNILIVNGYVNTANAEDAKPAKLISELKAKVAEQEEKMKTLARDLRDSEIERLKELIEKEYPLRTKKIRWFKDVIKTQKEYIFELQELLEENDIIYYPMEPADEHDMEEVENAIDERAVRITQDLNRIPKLKRNNYETTENLGHDNGSMKEIGDI